MEKNLINFEKERNKKLSVKIKGKYIDIIKKNTKVKQERNENYSPSGYLHSFHKQKVFSIVHSDMQCREDHVCQSVPKTEEV